MAVSNRKGKKKFHATFSRTFTVEVELPVPSGRYFLVAEQESTQRSRLKGQGRAPARHAFPLRIPQPLILQVFRNVSVQRGAQLVDRITHLRVTRGTEGMSAHEDPLVLPFFFAIQKAWFCMFLTDSQGKAGFYVLKCTGKSGIVTGKFF